MTGTEVHRARGRAAVVAAVPLVFFLAYAVFASVPSSAAGTPPGAVEFNRILPQGWAFFTRSPREPRQMEWQRESGGTWQKAKMGANSSAQNLFGAARWVRTQDVELGLLYEQATSQRPEWTTCSSDDVPRCLESSPLKLQVRNTVVPKTMCGTIGISQQEPLPWAWAKKYDAHSMPLKVLRLEVQC